jgi:hypothetical protein
MTDVRVYKDAPNRSIIVVDGDDTEVINAINRVLTESECKPEQTAAQPNPVQTPPVEQDEEFIVDSLANLAKGFVMAKKLRGSEREEVIGMCKDFIRYQLDESLSHVWLVEDKVAVLDTLAPMVNLDEYTQELGFMSYENMKDTGEDGDASLIASEEIEEIYDVVIASIKERAK